MRTRIKEKPDYCAQLITCVILLLIICPFLLQGLRYNRVLAVSESVYNNLAIQAVRNNYSLYRNSGTGFNAFDAYILTQAGADLETWTYEETNLKALVMSAVNNSIENPDGTAAKTIAYQYLVMKDWGEDEKVEQLLEILQNRQGTGENGSFDNNAFSDIPAFDAIGRAGAIGALDTDKTIDYILANRDSSSGAWTLSWNDFITTAQAVRALEYLRPYAGDQDEAVEEAIDDGLAWMKSFQMEDGSLQGGDWDDPAIDTAEALITLKLLEIDPETWLSGTGKTPIDYLLDDALNDDGTFGTSKNLMDNTWVLDAYLSLGCSISENAIVGIEIDPADADISIGETRQYSAKTYQLFGTMVDVTDISLWSSQNNEIASINDSGLATGNASGDTVITATYYGVVGLAGITVTGNGGNNGNDNSDEITVKVAVIGKDGDLLFGPDSVDLSKDDEYGWTALGALEATGLDWKFSEDDDELVIEIDGQRNKGLNGWMYKVNNQVPDRWAGAKTVKNGDKIMWWYSTDAMDEEGPDWPEESSAGGTSTTLEEGMTKSGMKGYEKDLIGLKQNTLLNQDKKMTAAVADKLKEELAKNSVSLNLNAGQAEYFMTDNEVSILIPEKSLNQTTNITVKELASSQQPKQFAVKLGSSVYEFTPSGTKFDQPVTIAIKVPLTEDIDVNKLSPAWYNEETKTWVTIPAVIDLKTGLVVFQTDHFTKFTVIQYPERKTFSDVGENMAWAKDAVEILAGKGFINGTGSGFEPKRSISRAEFVKIIVTALERETNQYQEGLFADVKAGDWFAGYVMTAYQEQIITGDQDGKFRPGDSISRNEVASVLFRLQEAVPVDAPNTSLTFKDTDKIPSWAATGIKYANQYSLMTGYADGTFKGSNSLTRAEAAVIIYRYLGLSEE
ncbi:MAG: S-layer homology domain-containing protein [Dehalobacterium sp.]